jgi:hypothetical protein
MKNIKTITIIDKHSPKTIATLNRIRKLMGIRSSVNVAEKLIEMGAKNYEHLKAEK